MRIMKEKAYEKYTSQVDSKNRERVLVISNSGSYALARECFSANTSKESKLKWIGEHKLCVSDEGRVFCDHQPDFYMDAITGSLYKNGKYLGSSQLFVTGLIENHKRAASILMALKAQNLSMI